MYFNYLYFNYFTTLVLSDKTARYYRQDTAMRLLPVFFLLRSQNPHLRPAGATQYCIDSCEIWRDRVVHRSAWLYTRNFTSIGARGRVRGPRSPKFARFGKDSSRSEEPVDRILQILGAFTRPTTLQ